MQDPPGGHVPQSLRATLSHASPSCSRVWPRYGQQAMHIVGVEQGVQRERLSIEVARGASIFQQDPNMAVVQHHWLVEPHLRVAVGVRE